MQDYNLTDSEMCDIFEALKAHVQSLKPSAMHVKEIAKYCERMDNLSYKILEIMLNKTK